jgi:hypothetical protein
MLTLNIIDDTTLLEDKIENYFLILSYCKKYNINFMYNKIQIFNDYYLSNINLTNIHTNLINLKENNNNNYISLKITKYLLNLLYIYVSFDDIIKEIFYFNYDNNLFIKYNTFINNYVCIHCYNGDLLNDPLNYLSIDYFKNKYDLLDGYYKSLKLIIISNNNNIDKYFNNYDIINDDNENDNLNIMINATYLITSNKKLDFYAKLLNKNKF